MVVGVNFRRENCPPRPSDCPLLGMDMVLDNVSPRLAVQKHPPYMLEDFVPAVLGSAGRERKGIN